MKIDPNFQSILIRDYNISSLTTKYIVREYRIPILEMKYSDWLTEYIILSANLAG